MIVVVEVIVVSLFPFHFISIIFITSLLIVITLMLIQPRIELVASFISYLPTSLLKDLFIFHCFSDFFSIISSTFSSEAFQLKELLLEKHGTKLFMSKRGWRRKAKCSRRKRCFFSLLFYFSSIFSF